MADKYSATGAQTTTASPGDTTLAIEGDANARAFIGTVIFSQSATPADNVVQWLARRLTAVGTRTTVTPITISDPGGTAASSMTGAENHTAEPTYTASSELLDFDLNQRATFTFQARPGFELVIPATAANGIGFTAISSAYSGDTRVTAHWEE